MVVSAIHEPGEAALLVYSAFIITVETAKHRIFVFPRSMESAQSRFIGHRDR